ncbi:Protein zds1 [Smittium culicis]|uniref:Protein zds1 n=1 Tax=Smittium culicis TaxID=133412 RepID=A0A1R1XZS4_9FUNG|nr:Protein zds1 [Smittium culicis]
MNTDWVNIEFSAISELKNDIYMYTTSSSPPSSEPTVLSDDDSFIFSQPQPPLTNPPEIQMQPNPAQTLIKSLIWLPARVHPEISPNQYSEWISKYGNHVGTLECSPKRRNSILGIKKHSSSKPDSNSIKLRPLSDIQYQDENIPYMVNMDRESSLKRSKLLNKRRDSRSQRHGSSSKDQNSPKLASLIPKIDSASNQSKNSRFSSPQNTNINDSPKLSPLSLHSNSNSNFLNSSIYNNNNNNTSHTENASSISSTTNIDSTSTNQSPNPSHISPQNLITYPNSDMHKKTSKKSVAPKKKKKLFQNGISFFGIGKKSSDQKHSKNISAHPHNKNESLPDNSRPSITSPSDLQPNSSKHDIPSILTPVRPIPNQLNPSKSQIKPIVRYPLHVERAIYQLAGIKLSDSKRPLQQQVLLSNMMYWYFDLINPFKNPLSPQSSNQPQYSNSTPIQPSPQVQYNNNNNINNNNNLHLNNSNIYTQNISPQPINVNNNSSYDYINESLGFESLSVDNDDSFDAPDSSLSNASSIDTSFDNTSISSSLSFSTNSFDSNYQQSTTNSSLISNNNNSLSSSNSSFSSTETVYDLNNFSNSPYPAISQSNSSPQLSINNPAFNSPSEDQKILYTSPNNNISNSNNNLYNTNNIPNSNIPKNSQIKNSSSIKNFFERPKPKILSRISKSQTKSNHTPPNDPILTVNDTSSPIPKNFSSLDLDPLSSSPPKIGDLLSISINNDPIKVDSFSFPNTSLNTSSNNILPSNNNDISLDDDSVPLVLYQTTRNTATFFV